MKKQTKDMTLDEFMTHLKKQKERGFIINILHLLASNYLDYGSSINTLIDLLNMSTKKDVIRKMGRGKGEKAYKDLIHVLENEGIEFRNHPAVWKTDRRIFSDGRLSWATKSPEGENTLRKAEIEKVEKLLKNYELFYEQYQGFYTRKKHDMLENLLLIYHYESIKERELSLGINRKLIKKILLSHAVDKRDLESLT